MKKKNESARSRGGYRPGSGGKFKYGEPTVVIRIPVSLEATVQKLLDKKVQKK